MSIVERMEANADRVLWCVHVLGPDDLYAESSHAAAVVHANKLNRSIWSQEKSPDDVLCFAYADMWPWSDEAHALAMKQEAERKTALRAKLGS